MLPALRLAVPARARARGGPAPQGAPQPGSPLTPRLSPQAVPHLSHGEAMELAFSLGTAGGNAAFPEGALEWSSRAEARAAELAGALAHARKDEDSAARETRRLERTLAGLEAARPALDALVGVAREVVGGATLAAVWEALHAFALRWMHLPGDAPAQGTALVARLAEALAPACAGKLGQALTGSAAVELVEGRLARCASPPAASARRRSYVGTLAGRGRAPVPGGAGAGALGGLAPLPRTRGPGAAGRAAARARPACGGCRWPRTGRSPSCRPSTGRPAAPPGRWRSRSRAATWSKASGRPRRCSWSRGAALGGATRSPAGAAPSGAAASPRAPDRALRAGPRAAAAFAAAHPLTAARWQERAARERELHPSWTGARRTSTWPGCRRCSRRWPASARATAPRRGRPLPGGARPRPEPAHLRLGAGASSSAARSPSCWSAFSTCGSPPGAPSLRELDPLSYGGLFHGVAERLYREHGRALVAGRAAARHLEGGARELADEELSELLLSYPLVGAAVREKERQRLLRDLDRLPRVRLGLRLGRRFVGVELPFGSPAPLVLDAGGIPSTSAATSTGWTSSRTTPCCATSRPGGTTRARRGGRPDRPPRRPARPLRPGGASAGRDLGPAAGLQAAYAYAGGNGEERAFRADQAALAPATRRWLAGRPPPLEHAFPPTPDAGRCGWCAFRPVCGEAVPARAAAGAEARHAASAEPGRRPRPPPLGRRRGRRRAGARRRTSPTATAPSRTRGERAGDAGAGTGKTTLLVERLVELVAPRTTGRRCSSPASPRSPSPARRPASCGCGCASGCSPSWPARLGPSGASGWPGR